MATFNDIHGRALRQILFYATKDCSPFYSPTEELFKYFSLAWVCREWRRILLPKFYGYVFITVTPPISTSKHSKVVSNIRLTVENGLSKYTQRLFISLPDGYVASGHLIELLDEHLFGITNWPSIYDLDISEHPPFVSTNSRQSEISTDMCDTISQYLHMHLPALTSISIHHKYDISTAHPLSKLVNLKLNRLSALDIKRTPIYFTHYSFSSLLTHLSLRLSPEQTTLPHIDTRNLCDLELLDIPLNFSWRCFHSESSDSFDFSHLESMILRYSTTSTDSMTATPSHSGTHPHAAGLRKIHMPKIKRLSLSNIPPSDAQLLAPLLLLHLDILHISGSIDVLTQMNLRFPFSKEIIVSAGGNPIGDTPGYSTFTESIFSSFSAAIYIIFAAEHYIPVSISSVGWSNLKELEILAFISVSALYRLVSQLPLLEVLYVRYITSDDEPYNYDRQQGTLPYFPDGSNFNSKLRYLDCFEATSRFPLVFDLDPLYELIANVTTLKVVRVPEYYLQEVQDHFSQANIQDYPHIQEICFTESFEVFRSPRQ